VRGAALDGAVSVGLNRLRVGVGADCETSLSQAVEIARKVKQASAAANVRRAPTPLLIKAPRVKEC
jgi:hypothetical protein